MLLSAWDITWGASQALGRQTLVVEGIKISFSSNAVKEMENTQICLVPSAYSLG